MSSMPAESERDFQRAVIELAQVFGWRVYHNARADGNIRSRSSIGFPDLVLAGHGRVIFAELKSAHGKTTLAQDEWRKRLEAVEIELVDLFRTHGGRESPVIYRLWRPKDWDDIERELRV